MLLSWDTGDPVATCLSHGVISAASPSPDPTVVATALAGHFLAPLGHPGGDGPHRHAAKPQRLWVHMLTAILFATKRSESTMSLYLPQVIHTLRLTDNSAQRWAWRGSAQRSESRSRMISADVLSSLESEWAGKGTWSRPPHDTCLAAVSKQLPFRREPESPSLAGTHRGQELLTLNGSTEPSNTCLSAEYYCY